MQPKDIYIGIDHEKKSKRTLRDDRNFIEYINIVSRSLNGVWLSLQ